MATVYYDDDADLSLIQGRKAAVLGYGSQGHAHALSLRDSGCEVRVGLPEGSRSRQARRGRGADRRDAGGGVRVGRRDHGAHAGHHPAQLYADVIAPNLKAGDALMFAHGFNIHYGYITAPDQTSTWPWSRPRRRATSCAASTRPGRAPRCWSRSSRTPRARPGTWPAPTRRPSAGRRPGALDTTFQEETETDLFGEQAVLCGGVVRAGQRGLPDAGRRGLPARGGLLRVPARAQAHRRPDVRGRRGLDVLLGQRHRRVRRADPRPAGRRRRDPSRPWPRSWPTSSRASSPASGWPRTRTAGRVLPAAARARRRASRSSRSASRCGR